MRSDLFMHEVTGTSNVFGRKSGVKVVFKGDMAATDHETIYLPTLGADKEISDEQQRIVRGYADHEAGHIRHTDRKASKALIEECMAKNNMLLKHTWNALEDIWLEKRVISEYPGSLENLKATASAVDRNAVEQMKTADPEKLTDPKFVGPVAITWEGRKSYGHGTGDACLDMIDPKLRARLPDWIAALDDCKRTEDVIELARKVVDELRSGELETKEEEQEEETPPPVPVNGGSDDGDDEAEVEGPGEGEKAEGEKGEGEIGLTPSDDPMYGDTPSGMPGEDTTPPELGTEEDTEEREPERYDEEVFDKFDLADVVKNELEQLTVSGSDVYRPYTTEHDKWHSRHTSYTSSRLLFSYGSAALYEKRLNAMAGSVNVARRTLERVLAAKMNRDWDYGREAGRLDTRRLVRAYSAQPNVFKMRTDAPAIDTAVTMLIDLSGSMCGDGKAQTARDVAIVFAEAMTKAGIAVEVLGFANESGPKADASVGHYSRYEPLDMYIFKAFDERLIDARAAMSVIDDFADGNNTDGEALLYAYGRLKKRPEKRRVMMTLSDGYPYAACAYGSSHLQDHLRQVVKEITARGVECVGIGICDHAVQHYYPRWAIIDDVNALGTSVMNEIGKVLVGDRFTVRGAA
jgi:cobaltochelatase CobT subunit